MNTCQMSDNSNRSAPSSPAGTIVALSNDQQATDIQQSKLSRSRSLSDISQSDSPREEQQPPQQQLQAGFKQISSDSLKVKIKTHNITSNNSNSTNITQECSNNTETTIEGLTNNKPNNKSRSKVNKSMNGGTTNNTGDETSGKNLNRDSDTGIEGEKVSLSSNMNNHGGTNANAANGTNPMQPQMQPLQQASTLTQQQILCQTQTSLNQEPTPPSHLQSQQQTLTQEPPTQPTPQLRAPSPSKSESKKTTNPPARPEEVKPKKTRARKQTTQSDKGAIAPNPTPTPPKAASKRTKKAKQNVDSTQATKSEPMSSQSLPPAQISPSTATNSKSTANSQQTPPVPSKKKRKPRATAANSAPAEAKHTEVTPLAASPPKRTRKKKGEQAPSTTDSNNNPPPMTATNINIPPLNVAHPQLLSVASNVPMGSSPLMSSAPLLPMHQPNINRQMPGISPLDVQDPTNRYSYLTISPYANYDYSNASSLTRPSLSRLFTSSASAEIGHSTNSHSDEISRAFEDLRDNTWSQLSKFILDEAQQFDIPKLMATLHVLRSENDRLTNKVRDLQSKRDQLAAMNARLDLPGPMLTQHLNQTSPNFATVVAALTNSPKSLPNSSPSPAMNKSPIVTGGSYNTHAPSINCLGPPSFIDRSSPLVGLQTPHSGVNSLKSSTISTPSPPTGALMAHGANRGSLMTVNNPPYMSNVHPSLSALNQLGGPNGPPGGPYYPRQ